MDRQKVFNIDKLKEENRIRHENNELEKFLVRDKRFLSSYTNEEFINEIHKCYGDLYDTSLVEYVNWKTKVKLICPIHGEFYREPFRLIKEKRGCPYCNTIFLLEVEIEDYLKKYNI